MAKKSNTTLKGYFNTGDIPTESNFTDLIDSLSNLDNPFWEIDTTGFTDSSSKLQAIFDAASDGDTLFLPKGIIYLITPVTISKKITVIGQGTKIKLNHPIKAFIIDEDYVKIKHIHFERFSGTKDLNQYGVFVNSKNNWEIDTCTFINLYHGIGFENTKLTGSFATSKIINCFCQSLTYGVLGGVNGEYVHIDGFRGYNNTNHIQFSGGNVMVTNPIITSGINGINVLSGANDSHGIISGGEINHTTGNALFFDGISKGMTVNAIHVFGGDIYLKDCSGVSLTSCMLDVDAFNFEDAVGSVFSQNRHLNGFPNVVDKSYNGSISSVVVVKENYNLNGTPYLGL